MLTDTYIQKTMQKVDVLQIGANVGNTKSDCLFNNEFVNKNLILIEPVPYLFQSLINNYKEKHSNNYIILLNLAISNKNDTLDLYVPSLKNNLNSLPSWITELSSTDKDHIYNHTSENFPDLIVDKISVPCLTINKLIQIYTIKEIEFLLVDTEGHDYDILMDLDLTIVKPKKIKFENRHTDGTCIRGQKYNQLMKHLYAHGYTLVEETYEDTTVCL
jgi:FkbM family methyltransferase